jgi:hypothetical protein
MILVEVVDLVKMAVMEEHYLVVLLGRDVIH